MRPWQLAVLVVGVVLPLVVIWIANREEDIRAGGVYAFDVSSNKLYVSNESIPPLIAPSGPQAGVLAYVIQIDGERAPTVVYLTQYTPAARERLISNGRPDAEVLAGMLVRCPEDADWVPMQSPSGTAICNRAVELSSGRPWHILVAP